ncbi:hypothetical protein GLOIN_2v1552720 [Rhizophagus irregularis DAOM 181602=DAOM 197198]|uniref:Uncharacterized protein n=1 Tax=Rhizophagus irregularis (strain DAOM 181602 / DAOM 197198 / MUCL 43194) TaxID=747089 RepID=A0A2P4QGP8_RHIID|nr:hypothetical protein GLOIN_2v1552720 [Rhizophagus irregularis DAOM 181602=DAOM 197198]POG76822.1 hypothetical protein GLOIN_2v1552720 [Rhizophagus irregularis DAOM 181602=DAOM 197198]GET58885.1 hypothetical protein GLOIN_2v1552720 [Rhizophagus irregularis DAOM 181602=DAOM 197198]|eukprot:XP_025183688.1 hypothetical protein GLOIN_2v1552720 [Rhizophagus irregularis DAOM 181602=DAOM 197198]
MIYVQVKKKSRFFFYVRLQKIFFLSFDVIELFGSWRSFSFRLNFYRQIKLYLFVIKLIFPSSLKSLNFFPA